MAGRLASVTSGCRPPAFKGSGPRTAE